jgi:hypothetical protein
VRSNPNTEQRGLLVEILQLSLSHLKQKLQDGSITPSELATAQKLLAQNRVGVDDLPVGQQRDNVLLQDKLPFSGRHVDVDLAVE